MTKHLLTLVLLTFCMFSEIIAQDAVIQEDTTVYVITEIQPRFPGCERLDTTDAVKNQCSQASLMAFVNGNILYPIEARENGNEGMVVTSFVVEKDGFITNPKVIKDIGGGCGAEALRVLNGMNNALRGVRARWIPGQIEGKPVRTQFTLPVRFRLKEPDDFILIGYDSVYIVLDDSLQFQGGQTVLSQYVEENLNYPPSFKDSCFIGDMDMKILVNPDGVVKVLDVNDYYNLGFDFQFEAIQLGTSTFGKWNPATRKGRQVPAAYDIPVLFIPEESHCQNRVRDYEKANSLAEEGVQLIDKEEIESGITKLTEAINLFPSNANFLYMRGQAYMNSSRNAEACADFLRVKEILPLGIVNQLIPFLCAETEEK